MALATASCSQVIDWRARDDA